MAYLISGQARTGSGTAHSMYWSDVGYVHIDCSGNSASAQLLASPDGNSRWMGVTSWALGPDVTATAQVVSFYPFVNAQVTWVSASDSGTGTVVFAYHGRLQGA